ncbi:MAG: sigma-54-dependent Fis family transcriptional regulator [Lentisphaerae bacterium]|jgi:DNA-binding NtrC family response regulator|nr:sigma-54-dependent Fis family transcriptional regulator [Lentisphaerota bacterium]
MSRKPVILIVDDEKNTRAGLARALRGRYTVAEAENGLKALEWLDSHHADVVLTDLRMPGMDGMTLQARLMARDPRPILILLTAYGSIETAVEAMKRGAYDFLAKPVNLDRLELLLERALAESRLDEENRRLRAQIAEKFGFENIIGESSAMQEVFKTIKQVAPTRTTVLIQGESGTGKELVARALHQCSPRAQGPFIPVHCAALTPTLLESELFGHEKGAFTGAVERRRGRFELADGGTLFLDEIGEIDAALQVKILRVLEERRFERVGGSQPVDVDVRLVAATNRDLKQMMEAGEFREDLFYRLYVVNITLPPLRERTGDIALLAQHYLKTLAAEHGKPVAGMTAETLDALTAYSWPGNVRELRNVIERMLVLSHGGRLTVRDLPPNLRETPKRAGVESRAGRRMRDAERELIEEALRRHKGNRTQAAADLGISRRTLHRKLNEFGLRKTGGSSPPSG